MAWPFEPWDFQGREVSPKMVPVDKFPLPCILQCAVSTSNMMLSVVRHDCSDGPTSGLQSLEA